MNERFKNLKSFSDVVDTMIRGLKKEWVKVSMYSYGHAGKSTHEDGSPIICFGCAATNTLCELMQESFTIHEVDNIRGRTDKFNYDIRLSQISLFESAINTLRIGNPAGCIEYLKSIEELFSFKMPTQDDVTPPYEDKLPLMNDENWKDCIPAYERYRDWLKQKGL